MSWRSRARRQQNRAIKRHYRHMREMLQERIDHEWQAQDGRAASLLNYRGQRLVLRLPPPAPGQTHWNVGDGVYPIPPVQQIPE
jgi:hypothetical protein